jgi:hypothetical protein
VIPLSLPDPIAIDRDTARRAARQELQKRLYHQHDEPLAVRVVKWIWSKFDHVLIRASDASPGGAVGLVLLAIALVVLIVVLRWRLGPLRRAARTHAALFEDVALDADGHRRLADEYAAAGEYAEAVRERLRAVVRELEQRALLEPRSGRTAHEAASEAGGALPELGSALRDGARIFDEIWYGGRTADAEADTRLRELDRAVRTARIPAVVA